VQNPVKIDPRSARPAGHLFIHDNRLYRPAQDFSRTYGGALRINRIDTLTETEFRESAAGVVRPPRKRFTKGLHTISCAGAWCIVDAKRYVFEPSGIVDLLKLTAKSAALRLGVPPETIETLKKPFARRPVPVVPGELQPAQRR